MIQKKNAKWRKAQVTRDRQTYYLARRQFQTAVSLWRAECERKLICRDDKKRFYRYVNSHLGRSTPKLILVKDEEVLKNGAAAAKLISREFASNFTPR